MGLGGTDPSPRGTEHLGESGPLALKGDTTTCHTELLRGPSEIALVTVPEAACLAVRLSWGRAGRTGPTQEAVGPVRGGGEGPSVASADSRSTVGM